MEDNSGPTDLISGFTDGRAASFNGNCLPPDFGFVVDLMNDNLAKLTLFFGQKVEFPINLVSNFICEPVDDGSMDDGVIEPM